MKLSDYKQDYYEFSGKASDVARTASFAGLALIWIFRVDAKPAPHLPADLLLPTALFALSLALDLLHYITATTIWGTFHKYHEMKLKNPNEDPELDHPVYFEYPILLFFVLKLTSVAFAYVAVGNYLWKLWAPSD